MSSGDTVAVEAPGYLSREQVFAGPPIALWPADPGYVQELVYDWELGDGSSAMVRFMTRDARKFSRPSWVS